MTKKKTTQRVRQWTNNELMKAMTADHDRLQETIGDLAKKIGLIESRLATINSFETLEKALEEHKPTPEPEPWEPKVGDWFVCDRVYRGTATISWVSDMNKYIGKPQKIADTHLDRVCGDDYWWWLHSWIRPATPEEVAKHLAEQEAKNPLEFGTPVKVKNDERTKDAELIQRLVDLGFHDTSCSLNLGRNCDCMYGEALAAAEARGFKPTNTHHHDERTT